MIASTMDTQPEYFAALAAAFVRGKAIEPQYTAIREANPALFVMIIIARVERA